MAAWCSNSFLRANPQGKTKTLQIPLYHKVPINAEVDCFVTVVCILYSDINVKYLHEIVNQERGFGHCLIFNVEGNLKILLQDLTFFFYIKLYFILKDVSFQFFLVMRFAINWKINGLQWYSRRGGVR